MITFLSSPKAFTGYVAENQRSAIRSWQALAEDVEVILYGRSDGLSAFVVDLGVHHVPDIKCTPSGIPYFNDIVEHARIHAKHDIQVYVNCDILLTPSIVEAIASIKFPRFVMVGERIDLGKDASLDVTTPGWKQRLVEEVRAGRVSLKQPFTIDYFVFRRGMWDGLPPVIIGRGGYDTALVAYCLRREISLVDATFQVSALHQYHDYSHSTGGETAIMYGSDATENLRIHGVLHSAPGPADADYQLRQGSLKSFKCRGDRLRAAELYVRYVLGMDTMSFALRSLWRILRALGILQYRSASLSEMLVAQGLIRAGS